MSFRSSTSFTNIFSLQELQIAGINFKAFDLGGHEIARRVWKDYYASVRAPHNSTVISIFYAAF